jgi:glucokinase
VILAGDVGGTKSNLALLGKQSGRLQLLFEKRFESKKYARFEDIVAEFLRDSTGYFVAEPLRAAGFGIAGPVIEHRVRATNLPWIVDGAALAKEVGLKRVTLLNDLEATAHSLSHLTGEEIFVLNAGFPQAHSNKALIAAGTGLGQAILFWDGVRHAVSATEGGHTDFAPRTEREIELLRSLKKRAANVSWEVLVSGRGFQTIHEFLNPAMKHPSFDSHETDPAPEITHNALTGNCSVCVETLDTWTALYGAEAGNLALKALPLAGLYVAGGIAVKILPKLKDGTFFRSFCDKEKMGAVLQRMPIIIVLNQNAPLLGAGYAALDSI